MRTYEEALQELHRTPLSAFMAERKRLASELRREGNPIAANEIAKRRRPTVSAWTVNQLYWHARGPFDDMMRAAARIRKGDLSANEKYREAVQQLRRHATAVLEKAGHGKSDAILRRVTPTLAAIGATGGFDPDPPGALAVDRDPPGFEAIRISPSPNNPKLRAQPTHENAKKEQLHDSRTSIEKPLSGAPLRAAAEVARRAAERTEASRRAAERDRKAARQRTERQLRALQIEVRKRERALAALQQKLHENQQATAEARETIAALERKLTELDELDRATMPLQREFWTKTK